MIRNRLEVECTRSTLRLRSIEVERWWRLGRCQKQVQGRFIRQLNRNTVAKMTAVVVPTPPDRGTGYMGVVNGALEYAKDDYSVCGEFGNQMGNYHGKVSYLQSITENVALGMSTEYRQGATAHPFTSKIGVRAKHGLKDMWSAEMTSNYTFSMDYIRDIPSVSPYNKSITITKTQSQVRVLDISTCWSRVEIKGTITQTENFSVQKETMTPFASVPSRESTESLRGSGWHMLHCPLWHNNITH